MRRLNFAAWLRRGGEPVQEYAPRHLRGFDPEATTVAFVRDLPDLPVGGVRAVHSRRRAYVIRWNGVWKA